MRSYCPHSRFSHSFVHPVSLTESLLLSLPLCHRSAAYIDIHRRVPFAVEHMQNVRLLAHLLTRCTPALPEEAHVINGGQREGRMSVMRFVAFIQPGGINEEQMGRPGLKALQKKGLNIKLNHRNGTHSSHSSCSLYCGTQMGCSSQKGIHPLKCHANTLITWKRDPQHGHLETINGSI